MCRRSTLFSCVSRVQSGFPFVEHHHHLVARNWREFDSTAKGEMWPKWKWHGEFRDGDGVAPLTFLERRPAFADSLKSKRGLCRMGREYRVHPLVSVSLRCNNAAPIEFQDRASAHREVAICRPATTRTFLWALRARPAGPFSARVPACRVIFQEPITEEFAWGTERSPESSSRSMEKERLGPGFRANTAKKKGERKKKKKKKKGPDVRRAGVFVECVPGIAGSYQYALTPCYNKVTRDDWPR